MNRKVPVLSTSKQAHFMWDEPFSASHHRKSERETSEPNEVLFVNQWNKKAFIQSRQPREAGVVVPERRSCPGSSARPVLVVATRAATRCRRAARGQAVDCENASGGGEHASPRRSAADQVPR